VPIRSEVAGVPVAAVERAVRGFPEATGYMIEVRPLRYRDRPHLSAWTDFDAHTIVLQIPEPFFSFGEIVPYAAKRRPGKGMRFIWLTEGVTFRTRREVVRFLYLHEWMHARGTVELPARGNRKAIGETVCDRFALFNYRRKLVTIDDAEAALRWRDGAPKVGAGDDPDEEGDQLRLIG
jgi:hypothetical protein